MNTVRPEGRIEHALIGVILGLAGIGVITIGMMLVNLL